MSSFMYDATVPVIQQMLGSLDAILTKAEQHATAKKIDPAALTQSRLFPDMFPLTRQVEIACHFASTVCAELIGKGLPKYEHKAQTFAEMHALIAHTLAAVGDLKPEQFEGGEKRPVITHPGLPNERTFDGETFALHYAMPQLLFHVTTTYALLRHAGVEIGKRDFLGKI